MVINATEFSSISGEFENKYYLLSHLMVKIFSFMKEPKHLCRCGCGKMLSARTERRHRDGQVPPRIAAIQQSQSKVTKSIGRRTQPIKKLEDSEPSIMDEGSDRAPSPMDTRCDDSELYEPAILFPAAVNDSESQAVANARAAVLAEWRMDRGAVSDSDDDSGEEKDYESSHLESEEELPGLEDGESADSESEDDTQSVDNRIEAEWEKEWAEMGTSFQLYSTQALY